MFWNWLKKFFTASTIIVDCKFGNEGRLPFRATAKSVGSDLYAAHDVMIPPWTRVIVSTDMSVAIPEGHYMQIVPRSGAAYKQGLTVLNTPGTVDEDYRGEVKVILINLSNDAVTIHKGDRIAQAIITEAIYATYRQVSELDETIRGTGGCGSTGVK